MEWQPIETVPINDPVLLFTHGGIIEGFKDYDGKFQQEVIYCTYDGCGGPAFECQPTHWMPLQPPPQEAKP